MAEIFSEAELKELRQAQAADELWDPALTEQAGRQLARLFSEKLRKTPSYTTVVGVGALGCQLANAAAFIQQGRRPSSPGWSWAGIDQDGHVHLSAPIERGHAVLVSGVMLPDDQLTEVVTQIRAQHATITDMGLVLGEDWPLGQPDAARALGLVVHPLITG